MSSLSIRASVLSNIPAAASEPKPAAAPALTVVTAAHTTFAEAPMHTAMIAQQAMAGLDAISPAGAAALLKDVDDMIDFAGPITGEVAHFADVDINLRLVKDLLPNQFRFNPVVLQGLINDGAALAGGKDP